MTLTLKRGYLHRNVVINCYKQMAMKYLEKQTIQVWLPKELVDALEQAAAKANEDIVSVAARILTKAARTVDQSAFMGVINTYTRWLISHLNQTQQQHRKTTGYGEST